MLPTKKSTYKFTHGVHVPPWAVATRTPCAFGDGCGDRGMSQCKCCKPITLLLLVRGRSCSNNVFGFRLLGARAHCAPGIWTTSAGHAWSSGSRRPWRRRRKTRRRSSRCLPICPTWTRSSMRLWDLNRELYIITCFMHMSTKFFWQLFKWKVRGFAGAILDSPGCCPLQDISHKDGIPSPSSNVTRLEILPNILKCILVVFVKQ